MRRTIAPAHQTDNALSSSSHHAEPYGTAVGMQARHDASVVQRPGGDTRRALRCGAMHSRADRLASRRRRLTRVDRRCSPVLPGPDARAEGSADSGPHALGCWLRLFQMAKFGSGDASPLPVEDENIIGGECADVPGPPIWVQELHFHAAIREQLDDSAYVTRLDLRIARAVEHGDHIQQLQFSCLGHINRRSSVSRLPNITGDQARNLFVDPDDPRRTNGSGAVRACELEVDDKPAAVFVRFADGCVSGLGSIAEGVEQETPVGTVQANQRLEESSLVAAIFMSKVEAVFRDLSLIDDCPASVGQLQTSSPCRLSPRTILSRRSSLRRRFFRGGHPRGFRLMIWHDRRGLLLAG